MPVNVVGFPDSTALTSVDRVQEEAIDAGAGDQPLIQRLIGEASSAVCSMIGRQLARAQYEEIILGSGTTLLTLTHRPIAELSGITVDGVDLNLVDLGLEVFDSEVGSVRLPSGWATDIEYRVTYRAGYLVPDDDRSTSGFTVTGGGTNTYELTDALLWPTHLVARDDNGGLLAQGDVVMGQDFADVANNGYKRVRSVISSTILEVVEDLTTESNSNVRVVIARNLPGAIERATLMLVRSVLAGIDRDPALGKAVINGAAFEFTKNVLDDTMKILRPYAAPGSEVAVQTGLGSGFGGIFRSVRA